LPALPFLYLLAGAGLAHLRPRLRWPAGATVLGLCTASLVALYALHEDHWTVYKPNPDWRSAAAYLSSEIDAGGAGRPVFTPTPNPRSLSYYDPRIQDVKNLEPIDDPKRVGDKLRRRIGAGIGDYAERMLADLQRFNRDLLEHAALRVYRSSSDPSGLRPRPTDGVCYLVRDRWHPSTTVDHTVEDLLQLARENDARISLLETHQFAGVSVYKVRIQP
jgi:hypothetical protein